MNYKKLIEDSRNGLIDWETFQLVMDNDGGYWYADIECEDSREKQEAIMEKKYGSPEGYRDVVDILNAAGINCDWC